MPDLNTLPPEDLEYFRKQGYSDEQIQNAKVINQPSSGDTNTPGELSTIGSNLKANAGRTLIGGGGAIAGMEGGAALGAMVPPPFDAVTIPAGGIIGGIIGAGTGGVIGQEGQKAVMNPDTYNAWQQEAEAGANTNPKTALATEIIASAIASGGKPSTDALTAVKGLIGKGAMSEEAKQALVGTLMNAGVNPAINSGVDYATTGQLPSAGDVAAQVAGGAVFSRQADWVKKLPGMNNTVVPDETLPDANNGSNDQSLVESPIEPAQTQWIKKDDNDEYVVDNKRIKQNYLKMPGIIQKIPEDADPATRATLQTSNDSVRQSKDYDMMRQALHNQEAQKSVQSDNQEDTDYQGGTMPEVNNQWENPIVKPTVPEDTTGGEIPPQPANDLQGQETDTPTEEQQRIPSFNPSQDYLNMLDNMRQSEIRSTDQQKALSSQALIDRSIPEGVIPKEQYPTVEPEPNGKPVSQNTLRITKDNFLPSNIDRPEVRPEVSTPTDPNQPVTPVNTINQPKSFSDRANDLADRLDNLKSGINPNQLHAFGIIPSVWDTGIDIAKGVIKAGGHIADAVDAMIKHIKANHTGVPINEAAIRDHVTKELSPKNTPAGQGIDINTYMGKSLSLTRSVIDSVRAIGTKSSKVLADAAQMAKDKETQLKGHYKNAIVQAGLKLNAVQKERVRQAFEHDLVNKSTDGINMLKSADERNFYNLAHQLLNESGQYRLSIGEPVVQVLSKGGKNVYAKRNLIQDPSYTPGMTNQRVTQTYRDNTDQSAIGDLDKEFHDYNTKVLGLSEKGSLERIANYKVALQGSLSKSNISQQDWFNANRKAQGIPLPPSFREKDPVRNLERYFDRFSVDASHYEFMEKNHDVLAALGESKDAWGNKVKSNLPPVSLKNPAIEHLTNGWKGDPISPAEGNGSSFSSLISSGFIAGPALEVHKIVSNVVKSAALSTNPVQLMHQLAYGLTHIKEGYQHAVENGVVKLTARSGWQMLDGASTGAERMQALARVIRQVSTLNDMTTKVGTGLVQAMNESIIPSKVLRANAGDVTSQLFIKRLDPTYSKGKIYTDAEMRQLASKSANYIHGTGDIRSLPGWMLNDSEFSGFFSLAHWSIAQTNNFMKDVYEPATRGDVKPLMIGVFGSAIGGYVIKELRQDIQGKKSPIPSLQEIGSSEKGLSGNKGLLAYNAISAMQYSGFGGLLSQVAKYPFDFIYKNNPQGATFPMDEVATDLGETIHHVSETIANDPNVNWVDLSKAVTMHVLSTNIQLARIAINQGINNGLITGLPAEKKMLSDKLAQLKRFDMVEGLPYGSPEPGSNPYMNIEQKKFKSEQNIGKAMQQLPGLVSNIMETYKDKPDVMMSKLKALKENNYSTFPSMDQMPMSFMKYIGYLNRMEGPEKANAELQDYMKHKMVNEAKASVVP